MMTVEMVMTRSPVHRPRTGVAAGRTYDRRPSWVSKVTIHVARQHAAPPIADLEHSVGPLRALDLRAGDGARLRLERLVRLALGGGRGVVAVVVGLRAPPRALALVLDPRDLSCDKTVVTLSL